MESVSLKHVISAAGTIFPARYSKNPIHIRRVGTRSRHFPLVLYSKKWDFQDFQDYAKPAQLLPASEVQIYEPSSLEQIFYSLKVQNCESLYKVKLQTSSMYGSSLTDSNAGVLLCFIDDNSNSILQRIPASLAKDQSLQSGDNDNSGVLHFRRGCIDEFIFWGPKLEKIAAIWVGLESGQWRLGQMSLTIICQHQSPSTETDKNPVQFRGFQYDFGIEDILLGEANDFSMAELRPCSVTELSGDVIASVNDKQSHPSSVGSLILSSEESMKEYADLKFSLLLYDAMLILAGSSIASFSLGENAALAFLTGGIGGFLYLLLLQRSVDGLPAAEMVPTNRMENLGQILGKSRGSLTSLVLAFALAVIAARYISGDAARVLTPNDLIFGMAGFLMCKISVVLAAFRPLPTGSRENK
ncbi:uncharacterized protein [Coffea arabica]|uniref:DUF7755 domain-containing protein n=1 Tax=Coffea arabica TaxID=13443 RepID=A0A6P6T7Y4_COFAR|nr:uncharacterized protein LOC113698301 isoform X2 [Coffea arabica]